ncbi:MAG: DUF4838 domain-containing protein [Victivallaceae bacterium]|nr:DUF4838 domain-containing protein [Victivallaceae bacterium]
MKFGIKTGVLLFCFFYKAVIFAEPAIVIADAPSSLAFPSGETVRYAAAFLQRYIQEATGKKLSVIKESEAGNYQPRIWLGNTGFAGEHLKGIVFRPEELLIRSAENDLILCGEISSDGTDRGTLFAVYEYLERALGIRWFFADIPQYYPDGLGTVIPKNQTLNLSGWNIRDYPRCRQREGGISYYYEPLDIQKKWHPVLRFGSSLPYRNANHTQINWYKLYHETHPEYFAKDIDEQINFNTRLPHRNYICPGTPGVLEQMINNLSDADNGNPPENGWGPCPPDKNFVYFAFNDGMTLQKTCHCPQCVRLLRPAAPEPGQASELVFDFAARYAEAIRARWPERTLVTLAFNHYRKPPETIKIPENLNVVYVTKLMHYANDQSIWNEETGYVQQWSRLLKNDPNRLRIWLNIVNPAQYTSRVPFIYPHLFQKWLRTNLKYSNAYFINGLNPYLTRLDDKSRMKALATFPMVYWQSRLLWNPDTDVEAQIADYSDKLFGEAANTMQKIFLLLTERWEQLPLPPETDEATFIHTVRYPREKVAQITNLFDQALAETGNDTMAHRRVAFFYNHLWQPFAAESLQRHRGQQEQ